MVNVFHFEIGDQSDWYHPEGCLAIEARSAEDALKVAKFVLRGEPRSLDSDAAFFSPLGEVARINEDKVDEILRFLYDRSQSI